MVGGVTSFLGCGGAMPPRWAMLGAGAFGIAAIVSGKQVARCGNNDKKATRLPMTNTRLGRGERLRADGIQMSLACEIVSGGVKVSPAVARLMISKSRSTCLVSNILLIVC